MPFRFHLVTMPHVQVNKEWLHCAYTQKDVKYSKMMSSRGHEIILYGNEGSHVEGASEIVQLLTEEERASFFGSHDRNKLYHLEWEAHHPYWTLQAERAIPALKARIRRGDFILSMSGHCHQPIASAFPGSCSVPQDVTWVEYGCGYYGTTSKFVVYESETHREWMHGKRDSRVEDNNDAAIPNFFDLADFVVPADPGPKWQELQAWLRGRPYYAFVGRVIAQKGTHIADQVAADVGLPLVIAGQGAWKVPDEASEMVFKFGAANVAERAAIMTNAVAGLNPTSFREPFGGTAVEFQLCGTPAITTDHAAFTQTTASEWRCASHREFVEAAKRAQILTPRDRHWIRTKAEERFSLDAVGCLYERYFQRLADRWAGGWYQMEPFNVAGLK